VKRLLTFVVAVLVGTGLAQAISLPAPAPLEMSIFDATNLFSPAGVPRPIDIPAVLPAVGDENRTVFAVTPGIRRIDTFPPKVVWTPSAAEELSGLFYDVNLARVSVITGQTFLLEFTPMGRNPLVGDVDGDTLVGGVGPRLPGFGGVVELYLDTTPDADISTGPGAWVQGGNPGGRDLYPTLSDGALWAEAVLAPQYLLPDGTPIVYREVIDFGVGQGTGTGFLNVTGGSAQGIFERGVFGPLMDVALQVDVVFPPNTAYTLPLNWNWQVQSSDPVRFRTQQIPEPATLLLLGSCVVGAAGYIRRRRAA
jgi:hypothetical protein